MSEKNKYGKWVRAGVDYAAPIAFAGAYAVTRDFQQATWVLVIASALALLIGWIAERRLAPLPLFAGGMALIFGSLTLIFHDDRFVKMKLTFVEIVLASALFGGVIMKKNPLKMLIGDSLVMEDAAWRTLSIRYGLFFLACAVANEVIWRTQTDGVWIGWRIALLILALLFSFTQVPFIMKHMQNSEPVEPPPPADGGF